MTHPVDNNTKKEKIEIDTGNQENEDEHEEDKTDVDQKMDEHEICKMELDNNLVASSVQGDDNIGVNKHVTENVKDIQEKVADGQSYETEKNDKDTEVKSMDINNNQVDGSMNNKGHDSSAETLDICKEMSTECITKKVTFETLNQTSDESVLTIVLNTFDKVTDDAIVDLQTNDSDVSEIVSDQDDRYLPLSQMPQRNPYKCVTCKGTEEIEYAQIPRNTQEDSKQEKR